MNRYDWEIVVITSVLVALVVVLGYLVAAGLGATLDGCY